MDRLERLAGAVSRPLAQGSGLQFSADLLPLDPTYYDHFDRVQRLARLLATPQLPPNLDWSKVTTAPDLKSLGIETGQAEGDRWLRETHLLGASGDFLLVITPWRMPAIVKSWQALTVNGYPGFELRFALPGGGKVISHDKYSSFHAPSRLRSGGENALLEPPSPRRIKTVLEKMSVDYPDLYQKYLTYTDQPATPQTAPTESNLGATDEATDLWG